MYKYGVVTGVDMMQALLVTVYRNVIGELHKLHIKSWKYYIR